MKIVIAAAMKEELLTFREQYRCETLVQRGKIIIEEVIFSAEYSLFLLETGIGKANAAAATSLVCEKIHPTIIFNVGSTGGFSKELQVGDVVCATNYSYSDVDATGFDYFFGQVPQMPRDYPLEKKWIQLLSDLPQPKDYRVHCGLLVTADSFMSDEHFVMQIKQRFPEALASDMESTAIVQIATFYHIPVLTLRGVSDIAGVKAPETFDNHLSIAATHSFEQTQMLITLLNMKK